MATEYQYIIDGANLKVKYDRVCAIIDGLEIQAAVAATNADVESYKLDDGQTTIQTLYRSPESIAKAILAFERLKNIYLAKLTGTRIVALRDAKTVKSNGIYYTY